ncbi:uncharacterized protein LOC133131245 [Conger conger]|uniref:uncharacterized protein LOC133131245 n=1 Tax=Conger conger TaxID=82655 RepID=UPI002A5A6D73|nr:uncharacterized protein LOC133131245 [Conger conger]
MHAKKMRPFCIFAVFGLAFVFSDSAEWTKVRLGDTVLLGCSISYNRETTWVRQFTDQVPTVVLISGPNNHGGEVVSRNPLSEKFTAVANTEDKTNQLQITNVTDADLALYYCFGTILGMQKFGKGTRLYRVFDKGYNDTGHEAEPQEKDHDTGHEAEPQEKDHAVGVIPFFRSLSFYTVYAALLGLGQLGLICAVFTVHLRSRGAANPKMAPRAPKRRHTYTTY